MLRRLLVGALLLLAAPAHAQTAPPTAQEIIAAADKVRNPGEPFRNTSTLTEYVAGKPRSQSVVTVYAKEDGATRQYRNLIRFIEPPRDAGKMVLLDGRTFWFYDPASKASVRISPQQRLIGQASIADVLTVNFAVDYTSTLSGSETIQDAARQAHECWHLDLAAATETSAYNRIEYWVEKGTNYPIKGKFYSDSGRLLKILYYRGFEERLGRIRPTEGIIIDAVDSTLVTTVKFGDLRFQDVPDAWFQRDYLPRFRGE